MVCVTTGYHLGPLRTSRSGTPQPYGRGKKYVSWGAPTPPSAFGSGVQHGANLGSSFTAFPGSERISGHPEARSGRDAIVAAWQRARSAGLTSTCEAVVSTWNTPVIVVGLLAIGSVIATALL